MFRIKDKESGIRKYSGKINGKWILMDYEPKKSLIKFDIDEKFKDGNYDITVEVEDNIGNKSLYHSNFTFHQKN